MNRESLEGYLVPLGVTWGSVGSHLAASWGHLEATWNVLEGQLGSLGRDLDGTWESLGVILGHLEGTWESLGVILGHLEGTWRSFGVTWMVLGGHLGHGVVTAWDGIWGSFGVDGGSTTGAAL